MESGTLLKASVRVIVTTSRCHNVIVFGGVGSVSVWGFPGRSTERQGVSLQSPFTSNEADSSARDQQARPCQANTRWDLRAGIYALTACALLYCVRATVLRARYCTACALLTLRQERTTEKRCADALPFCTTCARFVILRSTRPGGLGLGCCLARTASLTRGLAGGRRRRRPGCRG